MDETTDGRSPAYVARMERHRRQVARDEQRARRAGLRQGGGAYVAIEVDRATLAALRRWRAGEGLDCDDRPATLVRAAIRRQAAEYRRLDDAMRELAATQALSTGGETDGE